jgi:hypothetical protein
VTNFPNPFNAQTIVEFRIPADVGTSLVRLSVFDVLGREVQTLVDGQRGSGTYRVSWNGDMCPSGMYFLRLSFPQSVGHSVVASRKVLLLK